MLKSYYEILNISPDATKSEIKKQYKKLAKMYHPDVNSSLEAEKLAPFFVIPLPNISNTDTSM